MTIRRGRDWGAPGPLAPGAPVVDTDAALVRAVLPAVEAGHPMEVGLVGGDLHRTLGSPRHTVAELRAGEGMRLPVDLAEVVLHRPDGTEDRTWFCAHLVAMEARGPLFAGRTVVLMNAAFRGGDNLGPRAHPGDGLLDVTDGRLGWWERRLARARLATGSHLPHPGLQVARRASVELTFAAPARVTLDGNEAGSAVALEVACRRDAVTVVV